jgi:hypothetical protein
MDTPLGILYGSDKFLQTLLQVSIESFTGMEYSLFFICFEHCVEGYFYPYYQLLCGFGPVRCPTYCPNDRALRRHIYSIPPQYIHRATATSSSGVHPATLQPTNLQTTKQEPTNLKTPSKISPTTQYTAPMLRTVLFSPSGGDCPGTAWVFTQQC